MKKREEGFLPITDDRMTRFWILLEDAVQMVLDAINDSAGGEIYVPKIPSMKITDMATAIAPECEQRVIGIRPGEKLHECMIPAEESRNVMETPKGYIILPETSVYEYSNDLSDAKPVPEGFAYTSDINEDWISIEELRKILVKQGYKL